MTESEHPVKFKREREFLCHDCDLKCHNPEGKFFIPYDLGFCLSQCYETLNEALKEATKMLEELREVCCDGWHPDMDRFVVINYEGKVLYHFQQTKLIKKPDDLDEDGYSPSLDMEWPDENWDDISDYDLVKYKGAQP